MNPYRREIQSLRTQLMGEYLAARIHLIRGQRAVMDRGENAQAECEDARRCALTCFARAKSVRIQIRVLVIKSRAFGPGLAACRPCKGEGVRMTANDWICADCHGSGEPGMRGAA